MTLTQRAECYTLTVPALYTQLIIHHETVILTHRNIYSLYTSIDFDRLICVQYNHTALYNHNTFYISNDLDCEPYYIYLHFPIYSYFIYTK